MLTGNKGEWSELYTLLKLLADKKLYTASENGTKQEDKYFPILKIIRNSELHYHLHNDPSTVQIYVNGDQIQSIPCNRLSVEAKSLFNHIVEGNSAAFAIPSTTDIMDELHLDRLAAPNTDKTDITMQLYDVQTGYDPVVGFSIKSDLGSPPTLLNASNATNFIYRVDGITDDQMTAINAIDGKTKIKDRMAAIKSYGGKLVFEHMENSTFEANLMLIDSYMPQIISDLLLAHYQKNIKTITELVKYLEETDPIKYPRKGYYAFKIRKLLCSIALGMVPAKEWDGHDEANGGYIIVTTNGDVLAYHIYNRDLFELYLEQNTKLERGSTKRYGTANLYKDNDQIYTKLNLQIRFK